jgi:dTDP-4-dehydrorhamnose reductase
MHVDGTVVARQKRIAVTGTTGQLGHALIQHAAANTHFIALSRPSVDITDWHSVRDAVMASRPDVVIHAAAATNVDECEGDPDMAFRINALGTRHVARAAALAGADLVYVSTNYVFDGAKTTAYHEWDTPAPISAYGASKLAGEWEARAATDRCYVARTAWLYSDTGRNFVHTMRRLMGERAELQVVSDQHGNPTYATDLANAVMELIDRAPFGTYHLVNEGIVSWFDWACEIREAIGAHCEIIAISGSEYTRAATPPKNGGLVSLSTDSLGIALAHWRDALRRSLAK